jgi:hypothetical protein
METNADCEREDAGRLPFSVERIEEALGEITEGLVQNVWTHLQALCDIVGQDIPSYPLGPRATDVESKVPMIRIFNQLDDVREIVNQLDIHMNNLAHDLHPSYYEKVTKPPS